MLPLAEAPAIRRVRLATGLTYNVLEWEAECDHTILLLHGFLDTAWTWEPLVGAGLAGQAHLVAPDWRGHGDSDWVGSGGHYHFLDYLADLASLVASVARPRVTVVGHSMGGTVASHYCGIFPDRVERLVQIEGLGPVGDGALEPGRVARWIEGCETARSRTSRGYGSLDEAASRLQWTDPELTPEAALRLAGHGVRRGADGRYRFKHDPLHTAVAPQPFTADLACSFASAVTCPVLLIDGAMSTVRLPAGEAARQAGAFPRVRQVTIAGTAHCPHRHRPAEVAALILP